MTRGFQTTSAFSNEYPTCFSARVRLARETKKHRRANRSTSRNRAANSSKGHQSGQLECDRIANGQRRLTQTSIISNGVIETPNAFDITTRDGELVPNERSMSNAICAWPLIRR